MGNWRNRPPRRFYNQERSPSRSYYDRGTTSRSFHDDGVPHWEKKFCRLIGSIPWWKVRQAKCFMSYHSNILNWDDSAGEEAFQNAKKRFWADMNGLPCDITLPDPDAYIDKINWDHVIDPQLIKDLEQEYFAPDDGEKKTKLERTKKKTKKSDNSLSRECDQKLQLDMVNNPWECNNDKHGLPRNKSEDCSPQNSNVNEDLKDNENPWEQGTAQAANASNGIEWGNCTGKGWDCIRWSNLTNDGDGRSRGGALIQDSRAPRYKSWTGGRAYNTKGWEKWETSNTKQENRKLKRSSKHWEDWNGGCSRRAVYVSNYRNLRFKRDDNPAIHTWRYTKAQRGVNFVPK